MIERKKAAVCALALLAVFSPASMASSSIEKDEAEANPATKLAFGPPSQEQAPIALLVEVGSGQILHAHDPDRRFIPASMTKVMTAFVAFEMMADGVIDPAQRFPVSDEVYREWSGKGSSMAVQRGERLTVAELLAAITTVSANDASMILAEGAAGSVDNWVEMMNVKAKEIGMHNSHFGTPNGWPDDGKTFVTANDLVTLAKAIIDRHPGRYRTYFGRPNYSYRGETQNNRDPISGVVEGADGLKTGFTSQAGHGFLGSASRNGQRLVMVIGGTGSEAARARIAKDYVEWGFAAFERRMLIPPGGFVGHARVRGGDAGYVRLRTDAPVGVSEVTGRTSDVSLSLQYEGPLKAPIASGDAVASLRVTVDGERGVDVPLYAADDVAEGGVLDRLRDGLYTLIP